MRQTSGMPQVLLLADDDVQQVVGGAQGIGKLIDVVEQAFVAEARGEAQLAPQRWLMYPPNARHAGEADCSLNTSFGIVPALNAVGGRIHTIAPARRGLPRSPGRAWKMLFAYDSLALACLMEDQWIHGLTVGAHVGAATRVLASPDASVVAAIGAGGMARGCLRAVCAVRPVAEVRVFSPTPERREAFAAEMAAELGLPVRARGSAEEAVRGAHIVNCATNNFFRRAEPAVYAYEWLAPGAHVNSIAAAEADEASYLEARVVPGSMRGIMEMTPRWEPFLSMVERGDIPADHLPGDVGRIAAGQAQARTHPDQVTLYLGPGIGTHHAAVAGWVYEQARARGIGHTWTFGQ
jgi:alanine dehydrogenase